MVSVLAPSGGHQSPVGYRTVQKQFQSFSFFIPALVHSFLSARPSTKPLSFRAFQDRCVVPIAVPNFEAPLKERKAVGRSWYVSNFRNAFSCVRSDQSVVLWVSYRPSCHSRNEMTNEQAHPQVKKRKEQVPAHPPTQGTTEKKRKTSKHHHHHNNLLLCLRGEQSNFK